VTINNSAMIFGVLYGLLWLDPHTPNICILAGAVGVFAALAMIGVGGRPDPSGAHPVGREWLPLVLLGGVFSGVSFMVQTHVGLRHPGLGDGLWLVGLGFGQSAVILLLSVARDSRILWRRRRERLGGMVLGVSNAVGLPLTLLAFRHLGSEIVLPVSVTTPMVLVMVLGSVLYKERLTRLTWAGCLLAAFSVGLIGYGSARNEHSARGPHLPRAAAPSGMTHAQHRERARPEKKGSGTRAQWTRLRPDGIERLVLFRTTTDPRGTSADRPESVVELNGVCR
jgi:drug/metabolite transporter (DMT)-like permease